MASSSSEKGQSPSGAATDSAGARDARELSKELSRSIETCGGCGYYRQELGGVSFKKCSGCHSVLYCSSPCQVSHWRKEHKAVCKEKAKNRAKIRKSCALGSTFLADYELWQRNSMSMLSSLYVIMLREAASSAARSGALVTTEDVTRDFCAILKADYTAGSRLPLRIRGDMMMVTLNSMAGVGCADWAKRLKLQATVDRFREVAGRENATSHRRYVLKMLVIVDGARAGLTVTRQIEIFMPRSFLVKWGDRGVTAADFVKTINGDDGSAGAPQTKSSAEF